MTSFRRNVLCNEEIYHVYNRGVEKRIIFTNEREYRRAVDTIKYYQFNNPPYKFSRFLAQPIDKKIEILSNFNKVRDKLVDIIAYCFMPNHFHFLLRQKSNQGITTFMTKFANSYTKYFNTKHERVGPLLQGLFKSVWVEDDEQLVHISRYIHINPVVAYIVDEENILDYRWSSLPEFLSGKGFCESSSILNHFDSVDDYQSFIYDQVSYARDIKKIENLLFEG
jgi:putative transposase